MDSGVNGGLNWLGFAFSEAHYFKTSRSLCMVCSLALWLILLELESKFRYQTDHVGLDTEALVVLYLQPPFQLYTSPGSALV